MAQFFKIVPSTGIGLTEKFGYFELNVGYFESSSSFQEQVSARSNLQVQTLMALRIHVGERGQKSFCFWKSKVKIKCIGLPVRIHLKTFMGRQWLYLERFSVLRYSWEEQGVNIAPETLSIFKLLGNVRNKISIYSFGGLWNFLWH